MRKSTIKPEKMSNRTIDQLLYLEKKAIDKPDSTTINSLSLIYAVI